jgi:hypothetical protein
MITESDLIKDKEETILTAFRTALAAKRTEIVSHEKVLELLNTQATIDSKKAIPGGFSCGEDPEAFYIIYKSLCGEEAAKRQLSHELEHHAIYKKYNIPCNFGVIICTLTDGGYFAIPIVNPNFPENITERERQRIAYEANNAVTEKSPLDQAMIDSYRCRISDQSI